jgi:rubrerythrin
MCKYIEALTADFLQLLDNILKDNRPEDIKEAAEIANILMLARAMEQDTKPVKMMSSGKPENLLDYLADELRGAEMYHNRYIETNDSAYKQLAKDELRHADYFLKKARQTPDDSGMQPLLQELTDKYNELLNKLSTM